jgi:SAM-dependent methyltransferase
MNKQIDIVTNLHKATSRDYLERMNNSKVAAMIVAKQYGKEYWDGDRKFGYGGYRYIPGRWEPVARKLLEIYNLGPGSKILDVGCGKGFLLYEMQLIEPKLELFGFDISDYALDNCPKELKANTMIHRAQDKFPFADKSFDLVISLGTLHNLHIYELEIALQEIERVGNAAYVMVESFRNELEMFNLECWALTAETIKDVDEWKWIFSRFGYTGDYEFIFFE